MEYSTGDGAEFSRIALLTKAQELVFSDGHSVWCINKNARGKRCRTVRTMLLVDVAVHIMPDDAERPDRFQHAAGLEIRDFRQELDPESSAPGSESHSMSKAQSVTYVTGPDRNNLAPQVGLEPSTLRLTANASTSS